MKAMYFLDTQKRFRCLRAPEGASLPAAPKAADLERLVRYVDQRFEPGTEIFTIIDAGALLIHRELEGTAIGFGDPGLHRTLLAEELRRASAQVATFSELPPAPRPAASPTSALVVDSATPFLRLEEVDPVGFALFPEPPPPRPSAASWAEVEAFLSGLLSHSGDYLGTTVAANYLRQALRSSGIDDVTVSLRGEVRTPDESAPLSHAAQSLLALSFSAWQERCQRVIPHFDRLLTQLEPPLWLQASEDS